MLVERVHAKVRLLSRDELRVRQVLAQMLFPVLEEVERPVWTAEP